MFKRLKNIKSINSKTISVGSRKVEIDKFLFDLENSIKKGECYLFQENSSGYLLGLIKSSVKFDNYSVDLENSSDKFKTEMERLCSLANSEEMRERNEKLREDMEKKPGYIIRKNFRKYQVSEVFYAIPTALAICVVVACACAIVPGVASVNPIVNLVFLKELIKLSLLTSLGVFLASQAVVAFRTALKSSEEIKTNKLEKELKEKEEERKKIIKQIKEKERIKNIERTKELDDKKQNANHLEMVHAIDYAEENTEEKDLNASGPTLKLRK